jgi:hypothetical protein
MLRLRNGMEGEAAVSSPSLKSDEWKLFTSRRFGL